MTIIKQHNIRKKIKELAIGAVALLTMTVPMVGTAAAQNGLKGKAVDACSRTLGCGTATNIGLANIAPLYVDGNPCIGGPDPLANSNILYTNIKICAPGNKTDCQVIDHVIVDTGSVGLRIASTALHSNLLAALPQVPTSGPPTPQILFSCATFGDGTALYGPVQTADVYIAGKFVPNFPLQIFEQNLPANGCDAPAGVKNLGGNGLVGVRISLDTEGGFNSCNADGSNCTPENITSNPTPNLISKLQNDNNGITIALDNIPLSGATVPVLGLLIFGVGTQADNTPPEGTIPLLAEPSGLINLQIGDNTPTQALIDSGTSFLIVNDPDLPLCPPYDYTYCPSPVITVSSNISVGTIQLGLSSYTNTTTTPDFDVTFPLADTENLFSLAGTAYNDVALPSGPNYSAILGLCLFFGRTIYFVFDGQQSPLGTGPINAIVPQQSVVAAGE